VNIQKQLQFWDRFLKDIPNQVDNWPRVELDVRITADQRSRRAETDFPPITQLIEYFLRSNASLSLTRSAGQQEAQHVSIKAHDHKSVVTFDHVFLEATEITGYSSVKLFVQALQFPDVDLFVAIQKLDKDGQEVKFYHSTQQLEASASFGWLRVSHRELDVSQSTPERPVHSHQRRQWLRPGDVNEVEIELWPSSTLWEAGETLRLAIKGTTFTNPENLTQFKGPSHSFGEVRIWYGGDYDSRILVPHRTEA
jgi:uncharacterized protein